MFNTQYGAWHYAVNENGKAIRLSDEFFVALLDGVLYHSRRASLPRCFTVGKRSVWSASSLH